MSKTSEDSATKLPSNRPVRLDAKNATEIISRYDTLLLDVDGVIWKTDSRSAIPGTAEAIQKLRDMKKSVLFVSNNCMNSRASMAAKFDKVCGFHVDISDIIAVNWASAIYLRDIAKIRGKCYVLGAPEVGEELDLLGVKHCGIGPDPEHIDFRSPALKEIDLDPEVEAVLVAMDEDITYSKISRVLTYLNNPNCLYLAAADNEIAVNLGKRILPLCGTFIGAISTGSGRQPTIIGKPSSQLLSCILAAHPHIDLRRTLMIGDTFNGDMVFARNIGVDCMLVLSGMAKEADIDNGEVNRHHVCPDYVVSSVGEMGTWLP